MSAGSGGHRGGRLDVNIALGLLFGAAYVALDAYLDRSVGPLGSSLEGPIDLLHGVIDFVMPLVSGALVGVLVHYIGVRARVAELERQRADELTTRLHKIERDQAVWVISASLLHDLKTPLHALGLLLEEIGELPPEAVAERQALLSRAHAQSERLVDHLGTLRSLPAVPKPEVPGAELLRAARTFSEPLRVLAEQRGALLSVEGSEVLARFHPSYLRIILENLVMNALDASSESKDPSLGQHKVQMIVHSSSEGAWLDVRDTGPGLAAEQKEHLFEPLRTTKSEGLGLGLSIARGLARAMGGDLVLVEGSAGTCFRLRLGRSTAA